jgi:hypothetical protein
MTEQLRDELEALRRASRQKADDTRRLADQLEAVIARIVGRPQSHLRESGDAYAVVGSSEQTTDDLAGASTMQSDEREAQREALERLQNEMREHVADATVLADRIAALQLRIDSALTELAKGKSPDKADG